jgi:hypothetical protein
MRPVTKEQNFETVARVATYLQDLVDEVVFVGGSSAAFLITDEDIVTVRQTLDVDVIVEVINLPEYYRFEKRLRKLGFEPDPEGPICRFLIDGIKVDVMPDDEEIVGFSNDWYQTAIDTAQKHSIGDIEIRVVSAPLFLATKLEAHHGRSEGDYLGSHDMEDILAVIDGRPTIIRDCFNAPDDVKAYLHDNFAALLADDEFINVLPGFVDPSGGSARAEVIRDRLQGLVNSLGSSESVT